MTGINGSTPLDDVGVFGMTDPDELVQQTDLGELIGVTSERTLKEFVVPITGYGLDIVLKLNRI